MTTGEADRSALQQTALEILGLPRETPADAIPSAILWFLPDESFFPGRAEHEAILVLARRDQACATRLHDELVARATQRLEAEADAFAAAFFTVPVEERRARWAELKHRCRDHPRALGRLESLRPGLAVRADRLHDRSREVEQLVHLALELFVLPPVVRARARLAHVRRLRAPGPIEAAQWRRTAKRFKRRFRSVARLVPDLVDDLRRRVPRRRTRRLRALPFVLSILVANMIIQALRFTARPSPHSVGESANQSADADRVLREAVKPALTKGLTQLRRPIDDRVFPKRPADGPQVQVR